MAETFLIILGIVYLIYKIVFGVPKDIKELNAKLDKLQLQIKEMELRLSQLDGKSDKK